MPIHDPHRPESSDAHLCVAALGASNLTFAEAFTNEQLEAWISAHCHACAFYGGVARITVINHLPGHIKS